MPYKSKEEQSLYAKQHYQKNKEKIKLHQNEYNENNKEKRKLRNKEYNEKNKRENPLKYKMKHMVYDTKRSDIKYNRYDKEDHITLEFLQEQYTKQDNKCHYCKVIMEHTFERTSNPIQITIERKDNTIGHTKNNCVFSCYKCNITSRDKKLECSI